MPRESGKQFTDLPFQRTPPVAVFLRQAAFTYYNSHGSDVSDGTAELDDPYYRIRLAREALYSHIQWEQVHLPEKVNKMKERPKSG